ncbi:MAG: glyceraldehyde-3-phosphate dehydrogenase [Magnetococcales bacterium]|nr:glyceraldehyde-3-phosphate dehydrogenase [Magnetococcales bacterium]
MKLGINGLGRIGKLTLWRHVARPHFEGVVVNLGRNVGTSLQDLAQSVEKDSTYGRLETYLHGFHGGRVIENLDEQAGTMTINGLPVQFLRTARNPREIGWRDHGARLVVDCTGVFADPTQPADAASGSLRGHLAAGAEKVILSAPFKIKTKGLPMPEDATTLIAAINDATFDPQRHAVLSAASCTTTCLAFMMKPLLDRLGADKILSASMVTIHAATPSQVVLDALPAAGALDLRKTRSALNNIILTTTGAAKALKLVIPEMGEIAFMAESVRIPTLAGSLVILTLNFQSDHPDHDADGGINRAVINGIYREASEGPYQGYLGYSEAQNVSADIIGFPKAGAVIEAQETHTRTAYARVDLSHLPQIPPEMAGAAHGKLRVPVTQAVVYGWYDNELGSYANMLGDLTVRVAEQMV